MVSYTLSTAIRAGLLALLLGLAAALTAPVARGGEVRHGDRETGRPGDGSPCLLVCLSPCLACAAPLAEEWSWHEFIKYWHGHTVGRTSGIVGIVLLVGAAAFVIIMSKSR
jgi:hypothetical protein